MLDDNEVDGALRRVRIRVLEARLQALHQQNNNQHPLLDRNENDWDDGGFDWKFDYGELFPTDKARLRRGHYSG